MSERYESTDLHTGLIARLGGMLAIAIVLIFVAIFLFMHILKRNAPVGLAEGVEPPPPRLQVQPNLDLANLRAREQEALTTYRWIDRKEQIIAIPIEQAIDLTIKRGLPARTSS
jgi:hypothetical protein